MKKVIQKCDKCGQAIKDIDICDYCGKEIDSESMEDVRVTIERPMPDGGDEWDFEFCSTKCMTEWMQKRQLTKKTYEAFSPYEWKVEIRKKFNIPF